MGKAYSVEKTSPIVNFYPNFFLYPEAFVHLGIDNFRNDIREAFLDLEDKYNVIDVGSGTLPAAHYFATIRQLQPSNIAYSDTQKNLLWGLRNYAQGNSQFKGTRFQFKKVDWQDRETVEEKFPNKADVVIMSHPNLTGATITRIRNGINKIIEDQTNWDLVFENAVSRMRSKGSLLVFLQNSDEIIKLKQLVNESELEIRFEKQLKKVGLFYYMAVLKNAEDFEE